MIARMLKGLAAVAIATPLLAACVVYDSTGGENVTVQVADTLPRPAEAIRTARIEGDALVVRVDSNGCTSAADFELGVTDGDPAEVTLKRTKPDNCRALLAEGVELRWTYADLGLDAGAQVRVLNPLK